MGEVTTLQLVVTSIVVTTLAAAVTHWVLNKEPEYVLLWIVSGLLMISGILFIRTEGWLFLIAYVPFCVVGTCWATTQEMYEGRYMLPGIVAGWFVIVALPLAFLRHLNTMAWILLGISAALELTTLCLKPRDKTRPPARPSGASPPTPPTSTATRPRGHPHRGAGPRH